MRLEFLLRYFGRFHSLLAGAMLVPALVGLAHGEYRVWPFVVPAVAAALFGLVLATVARQRRAPSSGGVRRREGFVVVSGSWLAIVAWGAVPFVLSGQVRGLVPALFESASGFTTTGATIITDIEALTPSILFWRSFSQWLGGMGIIVLSVAILPELAVGGMQLFSAESSGLSVDRLAPRIATTAKRLWVLYVALTALEIVLLLFGGMTPFDAANHAFATTATGGFSTKNASVGHYGSAYIDGVITVFMLISATNFALQYRAMRGECRKLFESSELKLYAVLAIGGTALVTWDVLRSGVYASVGEAIRYTTFNVSSILTTTGFGTADYDRWPTFSRCVIFLLMLIGGCAGSTAGGLKIIRVVVLLKVAVRECQRLIHPHMVKPILVDQKAIDEEALFSALGFFLLYGLVFVATTVLLTALPHDGPMSLTTAASAVISVMNSCGPGLEGVGPAANYAWIHPIGQLALSFCMLLGRLEIYTLLILFLPRFWTRR